MTREMKIMMNSFKEVIMAENIHIEKVEVHTEKELWTLYIKPRKDLDLDRLHANLSQALRQQVALELVCMDKQIFEWDEERRDAVKQWIRQTHASVLLTKNGWKEEGCRVSIPLISSSDLSLFEKERIGSRLSTWFETTYGKKMDFDFFALEDMEEVSKEIEDAKLAAFTAPTVPPKAEKGKNRPNALLLGRVIKGEPTPVASLEAETDVVILGKIFSITSKAIRNNLTIVSFHLTDHTSSVTCKLFLNEEKTKKVLSGIEEDGWVKVKGKIQFDTFAKENILAVQSLETHFVQPRVDDMEKKRVELHAHTQYSAMDSVAKVANLVKKAKEFGHTSVAITDHGVLQAYPEAMELAKDLGIKVIYGMEGYLVHDDNLPKWGDRDEALDGTFVVFDIETTGLSAKNSEIIEIGAAKINNNQIIETYQSFVRPEGKVPVRITEITGISDNMVRNARGIKEVMIEFLDFVGGATLVAHNARFDMSFIEAYCRKLDMQQEFSVIDTLALARNLLTDLSRFNLKTLSRYFKVDLTNHHRASDDAIATAKVFMHLVARSREKGAQTTSELNELYDSETAIKKMDTHHILILVKNQTGLKNLYKLVSLAHLRYFYRRPRIPKSLLNRYREGLILGTACESGELFTAMLNDRSKEDLDNIVSFYDFLEVQPLGNNSFLLDKGIVSNEEELKGINKRIVALGEEHNKPVVATGDVHFVEPEDECYRKVLQCGQKYDDFNKQPPLYYRTTEEMLEEFSYLGVDKAMEIVVDSTNRIADSVEEILPIPDGTFPPKIEGSDEEIRNMVLEAAKEKYGDPLPELVEKRVWRELDSIINNGYSVLYLVAHKLVKKSMDDGYLVGSRGSVGSSLAATFSGITEVNPLPPHYVCPKCKNNEFFDSATVGSGPDLPEKNCPKCGTPYEKDGFDIPFEVFLGFEGDKEPDIDLNFSGEYQNVAHKYTEELFGTGNVFRAGTISTLAEKTAFGYVKNYLEENGLLVTNAEIDRLVKGCTGIKKTTGQHPGGIMVVPSDKDIYDFCPIQKPADDVNTETVTTHFDYHSISGRLLKLDILGHDDPTMIRMLEDLTGVDATSIPLDDVETMSLFTSTKALDLKDDNIGSTVGTYGVPEFGTGFVREMLLDIKPTAFADLIRISGFSHGTDVWLNNAQDLIVNKTATINELISTRDDIMVYLIHKGLPSNRAFSIMEKVRKGKGLNDDDVALMKEKEVPQWYIDSCNKIKYMFPKAHAVAYVTMAYRIAYFKVHHPLAYYATYFTVRADDFDAHLAVQGKDAVRKRIKEIKDNGNNATAKEKTTLTVLELILEMLCRGYDFLPVNLYESHYGKFQIQDGKLLPPFNALEGIGLKAAQSIYDSQNNGEFISIEDLQSRTRISKTNIEVLIKHGTINNLPLSNQISLF
ncbi:PolC-type DNA polymerase III [Alkalibacter rhizosphaerae]|uniref:DNA polymerase III PolC-type n=2 Tax=Alkalibacter rhizosphaerae TaxID=2815577 RepID=A0A974XF38_9FIRM|nr:PolC-type DNA polymerase III [Alkalibacter rhizosphaerae]QSX08699.1 PolC-type DNA polymerase III [Alkalibacter rhizosphaerae]